MRLIILVLAFLAGLCASSFAQTTSRDYEIMLTTASTAAAFTAKAPTLTKPSGDAVQSVKIGTSRSPDFIKLVPIGSDANNETFSMRVWGWSHDSNDVWWPTLIVEVAVTLGNIDAGDHGTNYFMADTITRTYGDSGTRIISAANDLSAWICADHLGAELIEVDFDSTGAAAMNVLMRRIQQ